MNRCMDVKQWIEAGRKDDNWLDLMPGELYPVGRGWVIPTMGGFFRIYMAHGFGIGPFFTFAAARAAVINW